MWNVTVIPPVIPPLRNNRLRGERKVYVGLGLVVILVGLTYYFHSKLKKMRLMKLWTDNYLLG